VRYLVYGSPFSFTIGGTIWLHKLAENLSALGQTATVGKTLPSADCIVVYPEGVEGNPLNARHYVRWLLNTPGVCPPGGPPRGAVDSYGESDLIVSCFSYVTKQTKKRFGLEVHESHLTAYENYLDVFVDKGLPRQGACFTRRKAIDKPAVDYIPDDALEFGMIQSPQESAEIFQSREVFYSYDHLTHFSLQAVLCGCLSIVVPDGEVTAEEWYRQVPAHRNGIAYGVDEIPHAKATAHLVRGHLAEMEAKSLKQTKRFIEITQEHFG
jgi:hypothetical protein